VAHIIAHGTAHNASTDSKTSASSSSSAAAAAATDSKAKPAFQTVVMIGDGITDVEACPPATLMIGYGGVKVRPAVKAAAGYYVTSFDELIAVLKPASSDS